MILSLADHLQFRDPCWGKSLRKWDCLCFSNHIQLRNMTNSWKCREAFRTDLIQIKKCVFSKIIAMFSNLWDHPNPTKHLDLGMELNDRIWFQAQVTNCHPRRTAELDTELNFHHLVLLGQKSSSSLHVPPPETTWGEACRFQNQEHSGLQAPGQFIFTLLKPSPNKENVPEAKGWHFKKWIKA